MDEIRLKQILANVFSLSASEITDSFSSDQIEQWTSLTHSNLVIALEQAYNVQFTTQEIIDMINYKLIRYTLMEKTR